MAKHCKTNVTGKPAPEGVETSQNRVLKETVVLSFIFLVTGGTFFCVTESKDSLFSENLALLIALTELYFAQVPQPQRARGCSERASPC